MKADIHPEYKVLDVICSCGNAFTSRSTYGQPQLRIEVCGACHPFYTGKHKVVDTEGRVEQFTRRYGNYKPAASEAK